MAAWKSPGRSGAPWRSDAPVTDLFALTWPGKQPPPDNSTSDLRQAAVCGEPGEDGWRSRLLQGDNLPVMRSILPEFAGRIDLVYLDPPFYAGRDWTLSGSDEIAFRDRWDTLGDYLQMLYERLWLVRELLAPTGSLIVHVNWRVAHRVQCLLDELLGPGEREGNGKPGFRNEIVWGYGGGGAAQRSYRRKHDNLFWYTKSAEWTFTPQYRPYTAGTRQRGLTAVKGPRYTLREEGATLETWWTDPAVQKILSPTAAENLKYPTQKPESLLERIIQGHSHVGDLVADFFCGSGTTGAVAQRLGRRWIMADSSPHALRIAEARLRALCEETVPGFGVWTAEASHTG